MEYFSGLMPMLLFMLTLLMLSGCAAYEGRIIVDESLDSRYAAAKQKIRLAVVVDSESRLKNLVLNKNVYKVYPDVIEGFGKLLGQHVDKIIVTTDPNIGSTACDVALYPHFSIALDYSLLKMEVRGNILDCSTGAILGNLFVNEQTELERALLEKIGEHSIDFTISNATNRSISTLLDKSATATANMLANQLKTPNARLSNSTVHPASRPVTPPKQKIVSRDRTPPQITIVSPKSQRGLAVAEKSNSIKVSGIAIDESGIEEVTVNGTPVNVATDGSFDKTLLLALGENNITITATDVYGNLSREQLRIQHEIAAPVQERLSVSGEKSGERYALIIGINRYRNLQKLATAVNDAQVIARILRENYDYKIKQVIIDDSATHDNIMKEFNTLRSLLKPADKLIIYYAGHGILDKTTDASYWLPVDAETNDDTKWIDSRRISDQLKRMSPRQILVIADSCYSGTLSREVTLDMASGDSRENYLRKLQEKPSRVLIASGGNEPVSDSGTSGHSIFAATLINALRNPTKKVFSASELLYSNIKEAVSGRSDQTPEYKYIRNSGHESGDFVFEKSR
jgi:hypothetical protein